jgi:hypothetical protein
VEDRISGIEDKLHSNEKTEELLDKRNMVELCDPIKSPNLRIMGIKEGEEIQAKGIGNIFNKIMAENFPNLKKEMPIKV